MLLLHLFYNICFIISQTLRYTAGSTKLYSTGDSTMARVSTNASWADAMGWGWVGDGLPKNSASGGQLLVLQLDHFLSLNKGRSRTMSVMHLPAQKMPH